MDPWVEISCRNFLPALSDIVKGIPVIYARSVYDQHTCDRIVANAGNGSSFPSQALPGMYSSNGQNRLGCSSDLRCNDSPEMAPQRWKEAALKNEIASFYSRYSQQSWKNIISIGDSIFERDA